MRLLGYRGFPHSGLVLIPSHLRTVHVSEQTYILDRSAWQNLTFPCPDADPQRVVEILEFLEMSYTEQVVAHDLNRLGLLTNELRQKCAKRRSLADSLPDDHDPSKWFLRLSDSETHKLHLARAFIMNPEVLVLQRPFRHFSEVEGEHGRVISAIHHHIASRGLCMPVSTACRRRPRTVFFTAETKTQEDVADVIWTIEESDKSISMRLGSGTGKEDAGRK